MLLYLTSNQKSNLIDPAVRNMTLPAKKLVGRFSLKSFVTKDMRNYANAKFFVVDAACIEESGNDFTLALQSFQMMFSARIIVILSGCEDVNGEVQRLLSIDVVNLVTGETMEDALDELTEALSEDGMQRYVVKAPVYEQPVTQREKAPEPDEIIPYRWNARNIRIAVAGSQRRSGVTVTAFNLASWLAARGAEVAYIEVNQNRHLQLLLNIYEAAPDGEHYTIDGIDCYLTNEPDKEYQFIQGRLDHLPHELSGGQQQRVAIARALIAKPDVIFADEPTGNLDSKSGGEVMELLQGVWKKMGKALVVITHDIRIARMADRQFQIVDGILSEVTAR